MPSDPVYPRTRCSIMAGETPISRPAISKLPPSAWRCRSCGRRTSPHLESPMRWSSISRPVKKLRFSAARSAAFHALRDHPGIVFSPICTNVSSTLRASSLPDATLYTASGSGLEQVARLERDRHLHLVAAGRG